MTNACKKKKNPSLRSNCYYGIPIFESKSQTPITMFVRLISVFTHTVLYKYKLYHIYLKIHPTCLTNTIMCHEIGAFQENVGHFHIWSLLTLSKCQTHWKEGAWEPVVDVQRGPEMSAGALAFPPTYAQNTPSCPALPLSFAHPPGPPAPTTGQSKAFPLLCFPA